MRLIEINEKAAYICSFIAVIKVCICLISQYRYYLLHLRRPQHLTSYCLSHYQFNHLLNTPDTPNPRSLSLHQNICVNIVSVFSSKKKKKKPSRQQSNHKWKLFKIKIDLCANLKYKNIYSRKRYKNKHYVNIPAICTYVTLFFCVIKLFIKYPGKRVAD